MASIVFDQERGSVILIILITIALFSALTFAFLQGTRGNTGWLKEEESKGTAAASLDCSNTINMARLRLESRGCGDLISELSDGSNPIAGAPSDGSCSVYHPNGGGVKNCQNIAMPATDPCVGSPPIGTVCADGAIYVGDYNGDRCFAAPSNEPTTLQHKTTSTGVGGQFASTSGEINTNAMEAAGLALYPAAAACRARGAQWFLPSNNELVTLRPNLLSTGVLGNFWLSNQVCCTNGVAGTALTLRVSPLGGSAANKASLRDVRCVRKG